MTSLSTKFDAFTTRHASYAQVRRHAIPVSVLVPKTSGGGKRPVMVRWHGGGFTTGQRFVAEWMPDWILALARRADAILIMPEYRLLPEATGLDVLTDIRSFLAWLLDDGDDGLRPLLPATITPDLGNVLVSGESAGGWLALQSGFCRPEAIGAVIAHYPMLDLRDAHYTAAGHKDLIAPAPPQVDRRLLAEHVAALTGDEVVTSETAFWPRGALSISMLQQGSFAKFFGDDGALYPMEELERLGRAPPPTWILHGEADRIVPVEGTRRYAEALRRKHPEARLHLSYREGDHGFDVEPQPATLGDDWVKDGLAFIGEYWPK